MKIFFCYFSARIALRPRADVFIIYIRAPECQNTASGHVHYCSNRRTTRCRIFGQKIASLSFVIIFIILFSFFFLIFVGCIDVRGAPPWQNIYEYRCMYFVIIGVGNGRFACEKYRKICKE